jgi:hypothetical protein
MVQATSSTSLSIDAPQGKKLFVFDHVFDTEITQAGVWEYLNDSVNAFLQGYNVSLLAYGQSGAGKSYTMGTAGPGEMPEENLGMVTSLEGAGQRPCGIPCSQVDHANLNVFQVLSHGLRRPCLTSWKARLTCGARIAAQFHS